MPAATPMARAVAGVSPLSRTTCTPRPRRRATTVAASGLMGSATPTRPMARPSIATNMTEAPASAQASALGCNASDAMPASVRRRALPTSTARSPTRACAPRPAWAWKCEAGPTVAPSMPRAAAYATTAAARGCSDARSTAVSRASASSASSPSIQKVSVTTGRPAVMVPVLSNTTVVSSPVRCRASPPLISTPSSAPLPVATITAVGTASPMAHGHAMISTVTAAAKPRTMAPSPPNSHQPASVAIAIAITTGTNTALMRSARSWIGARVACASRIRRTICESTLEAPSVVAR